MQNFMSSQGFRRTPSLLLGCLFLFVATGAVSVSAQDLIAPGQVTDIHRSGLGRGSFSDATLFSERGFKAYYDLRSALPTTRIGIGLAGSAWFVQGGSGAGLTQRGSLFLRDTQSGVPVWRLAVMPVDTVGLGGSLVPAGSMATVMGAPSLLSSTLSGGWLTPLGDGSTVLSILGTSGVGHSLASRDEADRQFWGPRIQLQKSFTERLDGFAAAGATFYSYRGIQPQFLAARRDALYDLTVGLNWTVAKGLSVRPQLSFIRNSSASSDTYAFDKADTSVNLRFDY